MRYTCTVTTPLGPMTAAADETAITGLWFLGQRYYPEGIPDWSEKPDHPPFQALQLWLECYFAGEDYCAPVPLAPRGTPFQMAVWRELQRIPYGATLSYGALAREMARQAGLASMSAQAVGGAVGHNPISILIPCHRVLGAKGALTGYAGGVDRKEALLKLERVLL